MNNTSRLGHAKSCLIRFVCASLSVWLSIAAAWWMSSHLQYGYPLWYRVLNIDAHIHTYTPHHPSKRDFHLLSAKQHQQMFAAITQAVHDRGVDLRHIEYQAPDWPPQTLLLEDEVRHLEDVKALLRKASLATLAAVPLWLGFSLLAVRSPPPPWRWRLTTVILALSVPVGLLWWFGPTVVFYQFHVWLFPPENPWFFYWEESLMSSLMRAPVLFGAIAIQIAVIALLLLAPIHLSGYRVGRLLSRR
jgi:hypothetical protein